MTFKQNPFGRVIISGDDVERELIQSKIIDRKKKPTDEQLVLLRQYLKDFQIKVHIPEFKTVAEMDRWKIRQVKIKLGC